MYVGLQLQFGGGGFVELLMQTKCFYSIPHFWDVDIKANNQIITTHGKTVKT